MEGTRPFDKPDLYVTKDIKSAREYAEFAGEAYDNALIAAGAFDKPGGKFNRAISSSIAKKVKSLYEKNRAEESVVLEVEVPGDLKKGDNVYREQLKYKVVEPLHLIKKQREGIELYSGVDPIKAAKLLKNVYKKFKGRLIKSVNKDQSQIIKDIVELHTEGKIDVDITYSKGVIWKNTNLDPKHKFDLRIERKGVVKADVSKKIPLDNDSVDSIMFDPPFLVEGTKPGKIRTGITTKRFTAFRTIDELWSFYKKSIVESFRVLKPGGKLVTKTQDITYGNRVWATSSEIYNFAVQAGFKPVDRFIYTPEKYMPLPPNVKIQKHSRKVHSDFWVFEKPKVRYTQIQKIETD
jgi:hypothetical protein